MRSLVLRLMLVLAALAAVPEALAADSSGGNVFLDFREGKIVGRPLGNGSGYSTGSQSSWGADGGYLWRLDDQRSLGFELGYMHFGKVGEGGGNSGISQISASAMSLGAHLQTFIGDDRNWVFQARGGLASVKLDDEITSFFSTSGTYSSHQTGIYFGFGIGRKITQGLSLLLDYSHYSANSSSQRPGSDLELNWIGLVAEYQF